MNGFAIGGDFCRNVVPYWLEREVKEEEEDNADYNPI
jgi:hypothetical protein